MKRLLKKLWCRVNGHQWVYHDFRVWVQRVRGRRIKHHREYRRRCVRCGAVSEWRRYKTWPKWTRRTIPLLRSMLPKTPIDNE